MLCSTGPGVLDVVIALNSDADAYRMLGLRRANMQPSDLVKFVLLESI